MFALQETYLEGVSVGKGGDVVNIRTCRTPRTSRGFRRFLSLLTTSRTLPDSFTGTTPIFGGSFVSTLIATTFVAMHLSKGVAAWAKAASSLTSFTSLTRDIARDCIPSAAHT